MNIIKNMINFLFGEDYLILYKEEGSYKLELHCENCDNTSNYDLTKGCMFEERHTNQYGTWGSKIIIGHWRDGNYDESEDVDCKNCGFNALIRI